MIVASPNNTHHDITMAAIERDMAVLCEKPVALTAAEAEAMAEAAAARGLVTMVPFTYRWMPTHQWIKELIDDGYVGRPYHLTLRYFAGFARDPAYSWRFDVEHSGGGLLGDLGSHCLHLARWWLGEVSPSAPCRRRSSIATLGPTAPRTTRVRTRPTITVRFDSGAVGTLQVSADVLGGHAVRPDPGRRDPRQRRHALRGQRLGVGAGGARGPSGRDSACGCCPSPSTSGRAHGASPVPDTYRDIFRRSDAMARTWVDAVVDGRPCQPDLAEGARVQRLLETAAESARADSRLLPVEP